MAATAFSVSKQPWRGSYVCNDMTLSAEGGIRGGVKESRSVQRNGWHSWLSNMAAITAINSSNAISGACVMC
jgi:hypothetical protein